MSGELRFAPAVPDDVPAIIALVAAAYERYIPRIGRRPSPMTDDYARLVDEAEVVVARRDGALAGVLVLEPRADHLHIRNLAVAPEFQGTGVGGALLGVAERRAREHGVPQLRLYTNAQMTENLDYYPRRGFTMTGRGTGDGFHRVFFARPVPYEGQVPYVDADPTEP